MTEINYQKNILALKSQIKRLAASSNQPVPNLIAVSKQQDSQAIKAVIETGQRFLGENYLQEVKLKWPALRAQYPDLKLHFIGHLQSNKAKEAIALCDVIETLDREKLAKKLASEEALQALSRQYFIQVNIGEEEQKSGINPALVKAFSQYCQHDLKLKILGLMAIPPAGELAAPYFAKLKLLAADCQLANLSMGMSLDYPEAIMVGSNYLRIGTAIFGPRHKAHANL